MGEGGIEKEFHFGNKKDTDVQKIATHSSQTAFLGLFYKYADERHK